jgi:hypothetical protein
MLGHLRNWTAYFSIRQHNGQKKKDNRTNNNLQNIHIKLKIELIPGF